MIATEPSTTSMFAAIARGHHRLLHARPWVLDDPFALSLVGPGWPDLYERLCQAFRERLRHEAVGATITRARVVEDRVEDGAFRQYVVLGAGLDSFAWRRPDLLENLRVIEVDHPATQAWKRDRAAELALPVHENHVFAAVDFETQTLREGLEAAGFDGARPALFSWVGVVPYLTADAVESTLRELVTRAAGSEVVLSYVVRDEFLDETGREFHAVMSRLAEAAGEPIGLRWSPAEAEAVVTGCGFQVAEHLSPADLQERYFAGRADGLRPYTLERVLVAAVPR